MRDYECLHDAVRGLHLVAFVCIMLANAAKITVGP
jgi:hypothetical protein